MRYYRIIIQNKDGTVITPPGFDPSLLGGATYTSYVNGQTIPGAWDIELDVPAIDAATSQGFALCRVWGVSAQEVAQANDLKGKNISIFGGMQKGLPLANPKQSGLLTTGNIFQAFGNREGTDQTLDLVISPGPITAQNTIGGIGTLAKPKNIVLNWPKGMPLGTAVQNALSTAFPGYKLNVNLSSSLVRPNDEVGYFPTLEQLAQFVREQSFNIIQTEGYQGASIVPVGAGFNVFDGTGSAAAASATPAAVQIEFQDLIGQPTWIESPNILFKTVMRADLAVGRGIFLPPTVVINTQGALSSLVNQQVSFAGGFNIISMRHVGHFRAPQGDAWVTVIEASPRIIQGAANA